MLLRRVIEVLELAPTGREGRKRWTVTLLALPGRMPCGWASTALVPPRVEPTVAAILMIVVVVMTVTTIRAVVIILIILIIVIAAILMLIIPLVVLVVVLVVVWATVSPMMSSHLV